MLEFFKSTLNLLASLYTAFPTGIQSWTLLVLRVGLGILFVLHGYPKLTHLKQWSEALKMPFYLCFLSACSMFLGGFCLIAGLLTPLVCMALLCSMVFALVLEIKWVCTIKLKMKESGGSRGSTGSRGEIKNFYLIFNFT